MKSDTYGRQHSINVCSDLLQRQLCIGCGVCAGICPVSSLAMEWNSCGEYNPQDQGSCLPGCRRCLDACPFEDHTENEDSLAAAKFGGIEGIQYTRETGYFLQSYVGYVTEGDYRARGTSGGVASWYLTSALKSGLVDKVVCVTPNQDHSRLFKFAVIEDPSEIGKSAKSAYYPVELSSIIKSMLKDEARYAIIGLPCFLKALELASLSSPQLKRRIRLMAGLTCAQLKNRGFAEYLTRHLGFSTQNITHVSFRDKAPNQPANAYFLTCSDGERTARLSWSDTYGPTWSSEQFSIRACSFCDDAFAELAEVVFMDAWLPEYVCDGRGTSIVIARTRECNDLLLRGVEENRLSLQRIGMDDVIRSQAGVVEKKRRMLAYRLGWAKSSGQHVPAKRVAARRPGRYLAYSMSCRDRLRDASGAAMHKQRLASDCGLELYHGIVKPHLNQMARIQRVQSIVHKLKLPLRLIRRWIRKDKDITPSQTAQHFLLIGNGPYLNRGCEAIVRGTVEILRREFGNSITVTVASLGDAEAIAMQASSETDASISHIHLPFPRRWTLPWLICNLNKHLGLRIKPYGLCRGLDKSLKSAAAVLEIGGDNYSLDYGLPELFLNLDRYALSFGVPLVLWGASVGPFDALPRYANRMAKHLRRFKAVFARESATIEYLSKLSVTDNVYRVCDPAFLMKCREPQSDSVSVPPDCIGLNFSKLVARYSNLGIEEWRRLCADTVCSVIESTGRGVMLTPHVMNAEDNDWEFLQAVAEEIPPEYAGKVICVPGSLSAEELKWVISRCSVFAGARTHSTIAALSTFTPTLSIAYSLKAVGLNYDVFGSLDYCINIGELTPERLAVKLTYMVEREEEIRAHLQKVIPSLIEKAIEAGPLLRRVVGSEEEALT